MPSDFMPPALAAFFRSRPRGRGCFRAATGARLGLAVWLLVLCCARPATAAITTNNVSTSTTSGATSLTWSHTVNSGTDRYLIVSLSLSDAAGSVTGITYGGTALTLIGRYSSNHRVEMWRLVAPAVGTANVVASFGTSTAAVGGALTLNGVLQTGSLGTFVGASGTSTTPTVTVSSALGELVLDTGYFETAPVATPSIDQDTQWNLSVGTSGGAASTAAGNVSVTMNWTLASSQKWDLAAVPIKPVPDPTADVRTVVSAAATVIAGATLTYTISLTNAGPDTAVGIIPTSQILPATTTFQSASGGGTDSGGGLVTWPAFDLASGTATNLTLSVTTPSSGTLTNTVQSTASTIDPDATNNNGSAAGAKAVTTITADVPVGGFTSCAAATNVTTTSWSQSIDNGPNRLLLVGVAFGGTGRTITSMTFGGVNLSFVGSSGVNRGLEIWKLVNPTVTTATLVANWSGLQDAVFWSGSFTNVDQTTPLGTFQSASGSSTAPSVTVSSATGKLLVDVLAAAGDAGTLTQGGGQTLICSGNTGTGSANARGGGSSKAGASSVTMAWTLGVSQVWNIGAIAINPAPPQSADVVTASSGAATILAGANLTYTIAITNNGPSTATNVVVKDTIPPTATFYSASGGGTYSAGIVTWPGFNLASGATTTFTLTVTAPANGTLTNSALSTATTYDPDASNNNGSSGAVVTTVTSQGPPGLVGTSCVTANNATTQTWSHTVPSGNNRILVVGLSLRVRAATVTSLTYGGVALTKIGESRVRMGVELWRLVAPTVGTANLVASWSTTSDLVGWSGSFTNVNQSTPTGTFAAANNINTTPTVTVTSASGELVIDTVSTRGDALSTTVGSGQAVICSGALSNNKGDGRGASSYEAGAPSVVMSWTLGASKAWEIAAVALKTAVPVLADVATTVSGPTIALVGANVSYSVSVTNQGPAAATNVVVTDTFSSRGTFVSATGGGTNSGGVITWPTLSALAAGTATNFTVVLTANAVGTLTNLVANSAATSDPVTGNNDGTATGAKVITTISLYGNNLSGFAYLDANRNGFKDGSETGSGLTLYAKIFPSSSPAGPATQAVAVNGASGAYAFTNLAANTYIIVLDNNNTLSDVTPTLPAGWSGTEMPTQTRTISLAAADVNNLNFGLVNGITLSGRVFVDNGAGGGTANDGVVNGAEAGKQGISVRLTDSSGATTHDTTTTDGAGNYSLLVPSTLTTGTILKVVEVNATGFLSTGAGVGNTGGTYDRTSDTVTFTLTAGTVYTSVNFGDVPVNTFVGDSQQNGSAGSFVLHAHSFTAGSAGTVAFSVTNSPKPVIAGWSQVIFLDANSNAQLDAGDTIITAAIAVNAGDKVSILVKDFIPGGTPFNAQDQLTVTVLFTYTGASPALTATATRTDLTLVGRAAGANLALLKAADRSTALPGETITYTVTYANRSAEALGNVVIFDEVPAFTTFASAGAGTLASGLTGVTIVAPSVGSTGPLRWTFAGSLNPGASGTVSFAVTLGQ